MKDLGKIMKQAKELQDRMSEIQSELAAMDVEGTSGGGLIVAVMNGKGELKRLKIDPSLLKENDAEILEDLIVAAHNDAKKKAETRSAEEMAKLTGGISLPPGLKFPT